MDGIERIKVLAAEIKNKGTLKVIEHLTSRIDMNEKYLNEEKSLKQMISFIRAEARKQAEDGCAMLEDEEVYSLAIHYWDESNKSLGLDKFKIKSVEENNDKESSENKVSHTEIIPNKKDKTKKENDKSWVPEGQLTLFDFI